MPKFTCSILKNFCISYNPLYHNNYQLTDICRYRFKFNLCGSISGQNFSIEIDLHSFTNTHHPLTASMSVCLYCDHGLYVRGRLTSYLLLQLNADRL